MELNTVNTETHTVRRLRTSLSVIEVPHVAVFDVLINGPTTCTCLWNVKIKVEEYTGR